MNRAVVEEVAEKLRELGHELVEFDLQGLWEMDFES